VPETEEPLLATEAQSTTEERTGEGSDDSSSTETTEQTRQTTEETTTEKATETPEGAPESYEFKTPEGFPEDVTVDSQIHDAYAEAARELNLPQDKAQGLFNKTMTALHKRAVEEQNRQTNEWIKAAKADPEFGGAKLEENLGIAKKALDEFGSDGLRALLNNPHGIGDHPEVIRFLVKVGQAIGEDKFVGGDRGEGGDDTEAAQAKKLYPSATG
jgi:hypothetical protein